MLQLDSDEDGPPLMPAGVIADPDAKSDGQVRREANGEQLDAEIGDKEDGDDHADEDDNHDHDRDEHDVPTRLSGADARHSEGLSRDIEETVHDENDPASGLHTRGIGA